MRRDKTEYAVGYSPDMSYNKDYLEQGLCCPYEHCIENSPLVDGELSCPIFGHDCPGGRECTDQCDLDEVWAILTPRIIEGSKLRQIAHSNDTAQSAATKVDGS